MELRGVEVSAFQFPTAALPGGLFFLLFLGGAFDLRLLDIDLGQAADMVLDKDIFVIFRAGG